MLVEIFELDINIKELDESLLSSLFEWHTSNKAISTANPLLCDTIWPIA